MELVELGALVFGITEVLKGLCPEKYVSKVMPLVAVLIGGAANVYLLGYSPEILLAGFMFGLAATGLYKTVK
jgi:hypothetical protein